MQLFRRKATYQGSVRLKFKHTGTKTNRSDSSRLIRMEAIIRDQSEQTQLFGDKTAIKENLFIKK